MPQGCLDANAHYVKVMNLSLGPPIRDICLGYHDNISIVAFAKYELTLVQRAYMICFRLQRHGLNALT